MLNEETQLVACFVLFCSTMYTQIGGMAASGLDETREEIKKELQTVDDNMLVGLKAQIESNQKLLNLEADVTAMNSVIDDMHVAESELLTASAKHQFRAEMVRKLDSLVALEESARAAIRNRMLHEVKAEVLQSVSTDKKTKDAALEAAIKTLAGGEGAARGKDIVGAAFLSSIKNYRVKYEKAGPGSDPVLVQLEKDVAAVLSPPSYEAGSNVYETHKISA